MSRARRKRGAADEEEDEERGEDDGRMTDTTASTSQRADDRMEEEHSDSGAAALSSSTGTTTASPLPPLKLRNYRPKDKSIAYVALTRPSYAADSAWLDAELSSLVESAVAHDNADVLLSIAPKSLNWDLKRDLAPKLALLKKQTAKALQELRQEKAAQQEGDGELSEDDGA